MFRLVEVSGDHTPTPDELEQAQLLITTPEKWDGITRSYDTRKYVRDVTLVVIDEIHLLGVERGAVLEAIVTRLKRISRRPDRAAPIRVVGLSTALANAMDIADWLGVPDVSWRKDRPENVGNFKRKNSFVFLDKNSALFFFFILISVYFERNSNNQ